MKYVLWCIRNTLLTNLKRKKKWNKNYPHVLHFAYVISKTCSNERNQFVICQKLVLHLTEHRSGHGNPCFSDLPASLAPHCVHK